MLLDKINYNGRIFFKSVTKTVKLVFQGFLVTRSVSVRNGIKFFRTVLIQHILQKMSATFYRIKKPIKHITQNLSYVVKIH